MLDSAAGAFRALDAPVRPLLTFPAGAWTASGAADAMSLLAGCDGETSPSSICRSRRITYTGSGAGTQWRLWVPASSSTAVFAGVRSAQVHPPSHLTLSLLAGSLLDDLVVAEDARADDGMAGDAIEPLTSLADLSTPGWQVCSPDLITQPSLTNAH